MASFFLQRGTLSLSFCRTTAWEPRQIPSIHPAHLELEVPDQTTEAEPDNCKLAAELVLSISVTAVSRVPGMPFVMESFMLNNLALDRPLAVIDLETTGIDPQKDRIVEISLLKFLPDGQREQRDPGLIPGCPSRGATAIHGITDADVADSRV